MTGKNIVVCSDGTGNTAIKGRGPERVQALRGGGPERAPHRPAPAPQVAIYDDGVGTEDFKPARVVAGATGFCGIVDVRRLPTVEALQSAVKRAYRAYRGRYRTPLGRLVRGGPDPVVIERFRAGCCHEIPAPVHFLGVWDTVDAVGLPFHLADVINLTVYRGRRRRHGTADGKTQWC